MPKKGTVVKKPKLVNRGPAGLLSKIPGRPGQATILSAPVGPEGSDRVLPDVPTGKKDWIRCKGEIVSIDSLTPDPMNAREHPERNAEAIRQSLATFGQCLPLVVRKKDRVIVAGNGRHKAMVDLGWSKCAVSFIDFQEAEAAGYGFADNRTAELARWNWEVVARLDKLLQEAKLPTIGMSSDELEVLRMAEWTPPAVSEDGFGDGSHKPLLIGFTPDEMAAVEKAVAYLKEREGDDTLELAYCVQAVCSEWLETQL